MQPFIGGHTLTWPGGVRVPHFYVLPELDHPANREFADLTRRHRNILTERWSPLVTPVQPQWLHATVQMIADPHGPEIPDDPMSALIQRAQETFTSLPAFTVWATPGAGRAGSLLDLAPDTEFSALHQAATDIISATVDRWKSNYDPGPPHISTGYCHTAGDSGPVYSVLRRSRPSCAPLYIRSVALVNVIQDVDKNEYRWDTMAIFPLKES